ncbi:MAG: hypothetical protein QXD23_00065 [Candidatus Micrarchaeaceae archaeon]
MFNDKNINKDFFTNNYLDDNFDFSSNKINKKSFINKLIDIASLILVFSTILFLFIFLIMFSLGEFLKISLGYGTYNLLFWSLLSIVLYGFLEFIISIKIYFYTKNLEKAKVEDKEYFYRVFFLASLILIVIFLALPNFLFFGNLGVFNTLPEISYTSSLILNLGSINYQYILQYLTISDTVLEALGILILFFSAFYAVFLNRKIYVILVTLAFIIILLVLFYSLNFYVKIQNVSTLKLLNNNITKYNQNLNIILNDYPNFISNESINSTSLNIVKNLESDQNNINNIFTNNASLLWNETELNNNFLNYGFLEYNLIKQFSNYGYQITSNNTQNSTVITNEYDSVLFLSYINKEILFQKTLYNVANVSFFKYQNISNIKTNPYYYGVNTYLFSNENYTNIFYNNKSYLENNDYILKLFNKLLNENPVLIRNIYSNYKTRNQTFEKLFYIASLVQYYNYAISSFMYNQSTPPNITYLQYNDGFTIINLGNINPNDNKLSVYIDNVLVNYYKYYNFIVIPNFYIQAGLHNITIKISDQNITEKNQFYISPYLKINSGIYESNENNMSILNVLISNPTNRTIVIDNLYLLVPKINTSGFYEQNIENQNSSIFWLAPNMNVSLIYKLYGNVYNNANYLYELNMNTSYGEGHYIFSGKEVYSTFNYNKNKTTAIILNSTTQKIANKTKSGKINVIV